MKSRRRGLGLLIGGLVMMILLAPAAFVGSIGLAFYQGVHNLSLAPVVDAGATRHFDAGSDVVLLPMIGSATAQSGFISDGQPLTAPACAVTGPDGRAIAIQSSTSGTAVERNFEKFAKSGSFTAPVSGDYRIDCGGSKALVLDQNVYSDLGRRALLPIIIGLVVAVLLGITDLILAIIGGVRLRQSRSCPTMDSDGLPLTR